MIGNHNRALPCLQEESISLTDSHIGLLGELIEVAPCAGCSLQCLFPFSSTSCIVWC